MQRLGVPVYPQGTNTNTSNNMDSSGYGGHSPDRGRFQNQPLPPYSATDLANYRVGYEGSQRSLTEIDNHRTTSPATGSVRQSATKFANYQINHASATNLSSPTETRDYRTSYGAATNRQSPTKFGNHQINHVSPTNHHQSPNEAVDYRASHVVTSNQQSPTKFGGYQVSHASSNLQSSTEIGTHRNSDAVTSNQQPLTQFGGYKVNHALQSPTEIGTHRNSNAITSNQQPSNQLGCYKANHSSTSSLQSPNEISNHKLSNVAANYHHQSAAEIGEHKLGHAAQSTGEAGNNRIGQVATSNHTGYAANSQVSNTRQTSLQHVHPFRLHRSLPLNDTESTHLFTFLLSMDSIEDLRTTPLRSSVASYQGHKWYLTSSIYVNNDGIEFLGVFLYWLTTQNHTIGDNEVDIRCRTDYRIIVRNVINPAESKISEGAQMEYSPTMTTGWGKRELIAFQELCSRGNGFINEPGSLVIVELAMKSCTTTFEHYIDVSHLNTQTFQDQHQYPAHFTPNFSLGAYEFYLSVYPRGDRDKARSCVSMYLHRYSSSSDLLGCRVRFRFFVGKRVSPSNGATFDYVFKENKGYGKYKAFEPLAATDFLNRSSILNVGVDIVSVTPLAQIEVPLVTRGYYHTDNFVFDEVVFPDHNFNYWKLTVDNTNTMLQLKFDAQDKLKLQTTDGSENPCTKFLQWRAFVISRKDKKKSKAVLACPITAFFSRHLSDSQITMSTQIPLQTAKELNGDYCTKQEPSLLVRLELLDLQDLPEAVHEQPVLHFERIQLYHMRDGFRRCMKVQNRLEMQIDELKKQLNELVHDRRVGKEDAIQQMLALLQIHENAPKASSPTALPHSLEVPSEASEPLSDSIDGSLNTSWLPPPIVNHHVPQTIEADPHGGIMQTDL
ncbi:uncharacterized protein LOC117100274 [Anneissia japonica]|uniref:uncharacterized protein LOC117100274 n=1 Tax=Anneissia japonica TaxID=1529436 RepID=UPI001425B2E4|nr:uncharacterized protein LOC117100274 [Anneissia japonica]XP_033095805.1 uncharacterized protein LOC117100274 [Anneissia japonica]XP_033095807.1 uncharacterized protein LOC117100274 [Anneissia japonica]